VIVQARRWIDALFWLLLGLALSREVRGETTPTKVTICDLCTNPEAYAGRMIQLRATILGHPNPSLDEPSFTRQDPCGAYLGIALEFPENVDPKPAFTVARDSAFQQYQHAVEDGLRIEATLEGRLDLVVGWKDGRRGRVGSGQGFGKGRKQDARLVLRKLSEVATRSLPRSRQ
jgi:hypothetical protein